MADTKYTKSVSTDFSSGVDAGKFDEEIRASSITSASLLRVDVSGDVCDSWFDDPLSAGDETTFDGLVSAHDGTPQEDIAESHEAYALDQNQEIVIRKDASKRMLFKDDENQTAVSLKTLLDSSPFSDVTGEPVGFPNRTDSDISFVDGTRTFTISPTGDDFTFYTENGTGYTKTSAQNVVITDTEGLHYIYFNTSGVLSSTTTWTNDMLLKYAFVSVIYWDATNDTAILVADERHGLVMDGATHLHLHNSIGTTFYGGLSLNNILADENGSLDTHAQLGTDGGTVADEDLIFSISSVSAPAQIPVFYRDGASGDWRRKTKDNFPVYNYPSGRLAYNEWTGSTWQQTEVGNNNFVLAHFFVTNDADQHWISVQGQSDYTNLAQAREGAATELNSLVISGLPTAEFVAVATVIFQTSNTYSNTPKARIRTTDSGDWVDWRYSNVSPSTTPQLPLPHKFTHENGGIDALILQDLSAGTAADGKLLEADGLGNWTLVDYVPGIPAELNSAIDTTLSSTDSTTFQQKLRLTTSSLSSGNYFVVSAAILTGDRNNTQVEARLEEDDTTELGSIEVRLTTAYAEFVFYVHAARALSGIHTFDLDYRFSGGSGTAQIKNATILVWKLSD